jgi:lipopolysaccharide/colanic/teichoic acid biosynthesis glycosyltransferase
LSGGIPRAVEAAVAGVGLALASPLIAAAALFVKATSAGPAFFRQERIGRGGRPFTVYKLRTMRPSGSGPLVTARGDSRVTPVGRFLRRSKLDELPQLWNVVKGSMSLVGPRPEVPRYVEPEDPAWRRVLAVRPGITDPVTLELRDEEAVLAAAPGDPERFYREELLPAKLRSYAAYLDRRSAWSDVCVLYRTVLAVLIPRPVVRPADVPSSPKR